MNQLDSLQTNDSSERSLVQDVLLAVLLSTVAALIGGWLVSVVAGVLFYLPVLPGFIVGMTVSRWCKIRSIIIGIVAAFFGFAGMVFGDALTFDLIDHPGTIEYLKHFYEAASPVKALFWVLNAGIAFWYTRDIGRAYIRVSPGIACPHCGQPTPARNRFCGHCGQAISE